MTASVLLLLGLGLFPGLQDAEQETAPRPGTIYFLAEEQAVEPLLAPILRQLDPFHSLVFDPQVKAGEPDPVLRDLLEHEEPLVQSREARALFLQGGSFMGWYHLAYPEETVSYLPPLLVEAAKARRPILAVGGACAFLGGGVVVPREELDEPQRNPRKAQDSPEARIHLDLGPGLMFGSDSWPGSSPGRLLQAMHENQVRRGAYFVGDVLMEYHRPTRTLLVRGPGRLLIFDTKRARSMPHGYRGARISSLGEGDHWKVGSSPILFAPGKEEGAPRWLPDTPLPRDLEDLGSGSGAAPSPLTGADLLEWLERPRSQVAHRQAGGRLWSLGWDAGSRRERGKDPRGRRTWIALPFDCDWRHDR